MNGDFENLYEVVKTITFELKTVQEHQGVNFVKSQSKIKEKYFPEKKSIQVEDSEQVLLEFGSKVVGFTEDLIVNLEKNNLLLKALKIQKQLVEKSDRQLFHKLKKITKIQVKNTDTGDLYPASVKFTDLNSLDLICKMAKDEKCYFVTTRLTQLTDKIKFYGEKIKQELVYKNNHNTIHLYSGNVQFYANWRAFLSNLNDLVEILGFISKNQKPENLQVETKWGKTEKVLSKLEIIKLEFAKLENHLKILDEKINEEAKKEIIQTSLNSRAVNKNPAQIKKEYQKVLELEQAIKTLTTELSAINEQKFDILKNLDEKLKENIESLKLLNDKKVLDLFQRSSKGEKFDTGSEESSKLKKFKFAKRVLKYIKFSGVLVTDKNQIKNYGNVGGMEQLDYKKNLTFLTKKNYKKYNSNNILTEEQVENLSSDAVKYFVDYTNLCIDKFKKSQELGNAKNLYNAINREVLRQKEMNYLSVLLRDSEFYYLALIQKDFAKNNEIVAKLKKNPTENWQMLDYHKITFKALEKLALLDESTFDIVNLQQFKTPFSLLF